VHNIAFEALYLPFISPNLAALLIGQSLKAGLASLSDLITWWKKGLEGISSAASLPSMGFARYRHRMKLCSIIPVSVAAISTRHRGVAALI